MLYANEEAKLHLVRSDGAHIVEEGTASGSFVGTIRGTFDVGPTVTGSVTLLLRNGGSIGGHGAGTLHNAHGRKYESFGGSLTITEGTGRYRGAHGHAGFYGSINRQTDAMQVQTRGMLSY